MSRDMTYIDDIIHGLSKAVSFEQLIYQGYSFRFLIADIDYSPDK